MAKVIQTLEDERMVSDVPLLVLSGEVFCLMASSEKRIHNHFQYVVARRVLALPDEATPCQ
jgi:hypothetical protein